MIRPATFENRDYSELLAQVEDFFICSGIRGFCTDVCGGICCAGCAARGPKGCVSIQGRKLSCSLYLCQELTDLFWENGLGKFLDFQQSVIDAIQKLALKVFQPYNIFYCDLPDLVISDLYIDRRIINKALSKCNCEKIKAVLAELKTVFGKKLKTT